jgi:serine/threonine protein kinase
MSDLTGRRLGAYELRQVIRRGGTSAVYQGFQPSLGRLVAIKVLAFPGDPAFAARFGQEARSIAALQHPNIIQVYDYGEQDGQAYLVMQYVEDGVTLADVVAEPPSPRRSAELLGHVLEGLGYAHQRGIVHRDVKPSNVLMASPSWPMLADFGIAKLLAQRDSQLTSADTVIGTPSYMTPEQAFDQPVDARTDLYSAGVVLYELLCGRVPFKAESAMATLMQHAYDPPPPPRELSPALPEELEAVVLKALAKDPAGRFQSAGEMGEALAELRSSLPAEALPVLAPKPPVPVPVPAAASAPVAPLRAQVIRAGPPGPPAAAGVGPGVAGPGWRLRWQARLGLALAGVLLAAVAVWGFSRQVGRAPGVSAGGGSAPSVVVGSGPPGELGASTSTPSSGQPVSLGAGSTNTSRPATPASTAAAPTRTAAPATTSPPPTTKSPGTTAPPTTTQQRTTTTQDTTTLTVTTPTVTLTAPAAAAAAGAGMIWPWPVGGLLLAGASCLRRRR